MPDKSSISQVCLGWHLRLGAVHRVEDKVVEVGCGCVWPHRKQLWMEVLRSLSFCPFTPDPRLVPLTSPIGLLPQFTSLMQPERHSAPSARASLCRWVSDELSHRRSQELTGRSSLKLSGNCENHTNSSSASSWPERPHPFIMAFWGLFCFPLLRNSFEGGLTVRRFSYTIF